MKKNIIITVFLFSSILIDAQVNMKSLGMRWGNNVAVALETTSRDAYTNLFLVHGATHSFSIHALREFDYKTLSFHGFVAHFLYGYGALVGFDGRHRNREYENHYEKRIYEPDLFGGICAYGAVEYELPKWPLAIRLDLIPSFEISTATVLRLRMFNAGVGIKWNFNR